MRASVDKLRSAVINSLRGIAVLDQRHEAAVIRGKFNRMCSTGEAELRVSWELILDRNPGMSSGHG